MQHLRKISAILLSLLVLLGSTSFTFNMHFCMGQMQSIALFQQAKLCEMDAPPTSSTHNSHRKCNQVHVSKTKKGCCEDRTLQIEGQDELTQSTSVSIPDIQMVAVFYAIVSFLSDSTSVVADSFKEYSPPVIERDIPVLVQSLLI